MDEYCGYEVEDVHGGTVLDEVMCETCGTIQPATNKKCSYCGEKLKGGGKKKKEKKRKKDKDNVESFFVSRRHRTEKVKPKPKPVEKPVKILDTDNSVIEAEPVEFPEPVVEKPKPVEKPTPIEKPKTMEKNKPMSISKPMERPKPMNVSKPADVSKPLGMPKAVEFPENIVEKPMEMPKPVEFPENIVEKPMEMPKAVEFPKPVDSFAEELARIHNDVNFPEIIVEKPLGMPRDVEFPEPVEETSEAVEFPKPVDSFAEELARIHNDVNFPEIIVEKPLGMPRNVEFPEPVAETSEDVEFPKPVDSFAEELARIHNDVNFPETIVEKPLGMPRDVEFPEPVVDESDMEMLDVLDKTPRQAVSISKPIPEKSEPLINPPRQAVSIDKPMAERQRSAGNSSRPVVSDIGQRNYNSESEDLYSEPKKKKGGCVTFLVVTALCVMCIGVIVGFMQAMKFDNELDRIAESSAEEFYEAVSENPEIEISDVSDENESIIYPKGEYVVGVDIPAGEYFIYADDRAAMGLAVAQVLENDVEIHGGWFQNSKYVKVYDGQKLHLSWCSAYDVKNHGIENDPFKGAGMFKVGVDVPAGTYEISPINSEAIVHYYVHDSLEEYDDDAMYDYSRENFGEDKVVELHDGQYLELFECKLYRQI